MAVCAIFAITNKWLRAETRRVNFLEAHVTLTDQLQISTRANELAGEPSQLANFFWEKEK